VVTISGGPGSIITKMLHWTVNGHQKRMNRGKNVLELISELYRITPKKASNNKGGEYHSPCPRCHGDDCFHIWPKQNDGAGSYWCRKCDKTGDNVEFMVEYHGMLKRDAFKYVGREGEKRPTPGMIRPPEGKKRDWEPREARTPEEKWQVKAMELVEKAHEALLSYSLGLKWFARRGINLDSVKKYKLGYLAETMFRHPTSWGLTPEVKEDGKVKMHFIPRGLVIPCIIDGKVNRLRIRRKREDFEKNGKVKKYYIVKGSKSNTMLLGENREVYVIVEAELDAMAIMQAAGDVVGAVALGSISTRPDVVTAEVLRSCARIVNALDYEIGTKAEETSLKTLAWWDENFRNHFRWPVPDSKDPGELVQRGGNIRKWIEAGMPPAYKYRKACREELKKKSEPEKEEIPAEILELKKILEDTGISILNTSEVFGIGEEDYEVISANWTLFSRASHLIHEDKTVRSFLLDREPGIIRAENILGD
jgi:hypothetical protein